MSKEKLAIVGIFYDGYEDAWIDYIRCFNHYWSDCPYKHYIVDNTKVMENIDNITFINAGEDAEYSRKVQTALEKIDADYYLLMLEDFFIGEKLDKDVLKPVMDFIFDENIDYYCLSSLSSFSKYKSALYDPSKKFLFKINPQNRYTLGCQAVIWKKDFLKQCIGTSNYNAWVFEGSLAKSKKVHSPEFLGKCVKDERNILKLKHGILQQKMIPTTMKYFERIGAPLTTQRAVMSDKQFNKYVRNSRLSSILPNPIYNFLKGILRERRGNAVLDKYKNEIDKIVKENFGY